jgi:DNA-binding CsgD family transcriptional regulator
LAAKHRWSNVFGRLFLSRMNALDQITEPQRECLRLVLHHHNSKEIAAKLGVSPSAVDKRIERAVQILGTTSRFAAARLLAEHEEMTSERVAWQPIDVPDATSGTQTHPADGPWGLVRRLVGLPPTMRNAGEARVRLSVPRRLGLMLAMMFVIAVTSMVLLNLATTLSSLMETRRTTIHR